MKIDTSEVKKGTIVSHENQLRRVIDIGHTHMGRGGATYTFKVKNIVTSGTVSLTFKSGTTLEGADVTTKNAVFLYSAGDSCTFMENDSSEMHDISKDDIADIFPYLKENLDLFVMLHEGRIISVLLPPTITYMIKETVPGIKGDRAQAGRKPAILENGLEVQIPLHKSEGDIVVVNTETGLAT